MKWQSKSPETLHTRTWGGEVIVYDEVSGNTHLLEQGAARVLAIVAQAPADTAELARALPDLWPAVDEARARTELDVILAGLAGISLIVPATP